MCLFKITPFKIIKNIKYTPLILVAMCVVGCTKGLEEKITSLETEKSDLNAKIISLESEQDKLTDKNTKLSGSLEEMQKANNDLQDNVKSLTSKLTDSEKSLLESQIKFKQTEQNLTEVKDNIKKSEQTIREKEIELAKLQVWVEQWKEFTEAQKKGKQKTDLLRLFASLEKLKNATELGIKSDDYSNLLRDEKSQIELLAKSVDDELGKLILKCLNIYIDTNEFWSAWNRTRGGEPLVGQDLFDGIIGICNFKEKYDFSKAYSSEYGGHYRKSVVISYMWSQASDNYKTIKGEFDKLE